MGKAKKIIIGVVVTALVGTGIGGGLMYVRKGSQKEVLVASVSDLAGERYDSDATLSGTVYANATQRISVEKDMIIQEVYVSKGDEVKPGDKLISFDMTLVEMELNIAKLKLQKQQQDLAAAKKRLTSLQNGGPILDSDSSSADNLIDSGELSEATPKVSDAKAVPSYMGQGNNLFTTSELARYATVMATSGNVFKLTLLDKVMDPKGDVIQEYEPEIEDVVNISSNIWDVIHDGMRRVIQTHSQFDGLGVEVAGKTGTAELDLRHPNHGLFIGYAPASDPEYAVAIRIANGYSSGNACLIANDIFKYMYNLADKDSILTGIASTDTSDTSND